MLGVAFHLADGSHEASAHCGGVRQLVGVVLHRHGHAVQDRERPAGRPALRGGGRLRAHVGLVQGDEERHRRRHRLRLADALQRGLHCLAGREAARLVGLVKVADRGAVLEARRPARHRRLQRLRPAAALALLRLRDLPAVGQWRLEAGAQLGGQVGAVRKVVGRAGDEDEALGGRLTAARPGVRGVVHGALWQEQLPQDLRHAAAPEQRGGDKVPHRGVHQQRHEELQRPAAQRGRLQRAQLIGGAPQRHLLRRWQRLGPGRRRPGQEGSHPARCCSLDLAGASRMESCLSRPTGSDCASLAATWLVTAGFISW
mmetsp:Transcript_42983/g.109996  ORF Transcript_42983/g.109996 Transcript_42983/m.109996 type:complete len:315 (-) Transcript_42983:30-974(-)